jgi:FdhD protein
MAVLKKAPKKLEAHQPLYDKTGGAHAAALLDTKGHILLHCEDMGRHNALDKVIGAAISKGMSSHDKILLSSGRASLEMILKTARVGIPVFVAMSRPTSRSVEAAKFYNITLVDMARKSNRIYSHVRRIEEYDPH